MNMTIGYQKKRTSLKCFIFSALLFLISPGFGFCEDSEEENFLGKTAQARLEVEKAWETYHHAALGGTLASPMVQTELEMNLHKLRALLAEAYDAEDKGDMKAVNKMISQIMKINKKVITESQEPKK
jgi:hypothetical protein|tara:strand:- start:1602 stop:1982 length:381 start_codon:yes stop_codon:yes gene_type:complete